MKIAFYAITLFIFISCSTGNRPEGTHNAEGDHMVFSDTTTGWTTRYPKRWKALTQKEMRAMEGKGEDVLEEAAGGELVLTHRNLLWLKKDDFNSMTSNYQPYDAVTDGSYEEMENMITGVLEKAYQQQGIQFESKTGTSMIDGLAFSMWEATILTPDRSDTIMTQVMYQRLLDKRTAILININYGSMADRDTLMSIVNASKFTIRD